MRQLSSLITRPLTLDDAPAAVALLNIVNRLHAGGATDTVADLRRDWTEPGFDLGRSVWGAFDGSRMVGYVQVSDTSSLPVRPDVWFCVHPDYVDGDLGRDLLTWGEARARQVFDRLPPDVRVSLEMSVFSTDHASQRTLKAAGFRLTDFGWLRMVTELNGPPPQPAWPTGYTLTTAAHLDDLRPILRAKKAAFADHRGYVDEDFEAAFARWQAQLHRDPLYDPALLFALMVGGEVVGTVQCRAQSWGHPERGYLSSLGITREHRRKGLAKALVLHGFDALWRQGARAVDLYVDHDSPTGAHRLYEQIGMRVDVRYQTMEKELRAGRDLARHTG